MTRGPATVRGFFRALRLAASFRRALVIPALASSSRLNRRGHIGFCTAWNNSLIFMPSPSEMRYSVSIDAEFLPSSICDR